MRYFQPVVVFLLFLVSVGVYLSFFVAPRVEEQGVFHKILYIHIPSILLVLTVTLVFVFFSLLYLFKNRGWADSFAWSFAKLGLPLTFLSLVTWVFWTRSERAKWWIWEPYVILLIATFGMYLVYIAIGITDEKTKVNTRKIRATVSILGTISLLMIWIVAEGTVFRNAEHGQKYLSIATVFDYIRQRDLKVLAYNTFVLLATSFVIAVRDAVRRYSNILLKVPRRGKSTLKEP